MPARHPKPCARRARKNVRPAHVCYGFPSRSMGHMGLLRIVWAGFLLGFCACSDGSGKDSEMGSPSPGGPETSDSPGPSDGGPGSTPSSPNPNEVSGPDTSGSPDQPGPSAPSIDAPPNPTAPSGPNTPTLAASQVSSCITYMQTACSRYLQCSINTSCDTISHTCPDILFSEGSTRSVQEILDCAEAWRSFDCDALQRGEYPECVRPGTRADGATCAFHGQCASDWCSRHSEGECGECLTPVSLPMPTEPAGPALVPLPQLQPGDPCTNSQQCPGQHYCHATPPDMGECRPYPTLGEDCRQPRTCGGGTYCELEGLTCHALPGLGEPCGVDGWTGTAGWCAGGFVCERQSERVGTCVAVPEVGEPCVIWTLENQSTSTICKHPATCDTAVEPPICRAPIRILEPGEACGTGPDVCHPASTCVDGICEPLESQGLFRDWCGGG